MDLILGKWSDAWLARLDDDELEIYEALLNESDHDLYQWVTGQQAAPEAYRAMIARIAANAAPS